MGRWTLTRRRTAVVPTAAEPVDSSRREALRLGGAALVGGVGALTVAGASPAHAATADTLRAGQRNAASGTDTTSVEAAGSEAAYTLATTGVMSGVSAGLLGVGAPDKDGIRGVATGTAGYGVHGRGDSGYGVVGHSSTGVSLFAAGSGRLLQQLSPWRGAPSASNGSFLVGELLRDADGEVWICTADGTPGTWRRLPSVGSAERGGAVVMLPTPYRVVDTRGGVAANATITGRRTNGGITTVQVTGHSLPGVTPVPAGATGVLANLTVAGPLGIGYLVAFPGDSSVPTTSSLNFTPGQTVANSATVGLSPAGALKVQVVGSTAHVLVDVVGYLR